MKAYRVTDGSFSTPDHYDPTRDGAHRAAKERPIRAEVRIEYVEFSIDQAAVCNLLNGRGCAVTVLRTWAVTDRGGLKEVPNGE